MVRTSDALRTIATAVETLGLPEPREYYIAGTSVRLGFRRPADVDAWARHLGMRVDGVTAGGEYVSIEFARHGCDVWCGAEAVTLAAPAPPLAPDRGSARTAVSVAVLAIGAALLLAGLLTGLDTAGWW